jgi:carboxyl-terminal processing protease
MKTAGFQFIVVCTFLAATLAAAGQPPQASKLSPDAVERYVESVSSVLEHIATSYHFEAIPKENLAGTALLALYQAAKLPPPEELAKDPAKYVQSLAGKSLREKLVSGRRAVGDLPPIRYESDVHVSLKAVFAGLDPFSVYTPVNQGARTLADEGAGIGLFLEDRPRGGAYFVRSVQFNSLAQRAGIRPGDELLEVDRAPIDSQTPTSLVQLLIATKVQRMAGVQLFVRHIEGETKRIDIKSRESFDLPVNDVMLQSVGDEALLGYRQRGPGEWDFWLDRTNRIGIIRFGVIKLRVRDGGEIKDTGRAVGQLISAMKEAGMKGLVIDLRDSPSGFTDPASEVAGLFLSEGTTIATCQYRDPQKEEALSSTGTSNGKFVKKNTGNPTFTDLPLVVLTGPETSGAAEMIAAALQDHQRAKIVGQRTRGKASIQETPNLRGPANHYYRLTIGVFQRPSGRPLHRLPGLTPHDDWGVRPDVEVVISNQLRRQVRAWWFEHDLLPPNDPRVTPLDDPRNDPILDAGLQVLMRPKSAQ